MCVLYIVKQTLTIMTLLDGMASVCRQMMLLMMIMAMMLTAI